MLKKLVSAAYFTMGIISAIIAYVLSQKVMDGLPLTFNPSKLTAGGGVDIAADGGALGFALLSGICFFCCAYLLKDNGKLK